jgi:membrane dipeptidase
MIDGSPAVLRLYYQLGVRYLTLTHGCHTSWADSCGPKEPLHDGINEFGRQMIAEMNRMGMLVDLSHVSHETMRQVLNHTRAPVIFSHSSAFALCPDPRNVPDDVLARLRETDGVVMVNFYSGFITCDPAERGTAADVADHIEHIVRIAGGEHVGLGADFDGVDRLPVGLDDVASYPNLIAELIRRRMDEKTIAGLLGKNLLRVWRRVEQYRDSQVNGGLVLEDFQHLEKQCAVAGEFLTIQSYAAAD